MWGNLDDGLVVPPVIEEEEEEKAQHQGEERDKEKSSDHTTACRGRENRQLLPTPGASVAPLLEAVQTFDQQREPGRTAEETHCSPNPATARDPRLDVGPHRLAMAAETKKRGRKLSRWALAKGRKYGGHLPVTLEGWVELINTKVCHITWLFHDRNGLN